MSTEVSLRDEQSFYAGIADVRSDSSDTNWALFGHCDNNPNEIYFISSGEGGTEEMVENMDDAQVMYSLVRLTETIDVSTTVKFAYIHWVGSNFPFTKRGKYGVVHGSIEKYFDPYHVLIDDVDSREELTTDYIMAKIQGTSGTRSKVLDTSEAKQRPERGFTSGTTTKADVTGATPTQSANLGKIGRLGSSFTGIALQSKGTGGLRFDDGVGEAIDEVRRDTSETNWMVCSYEDGNVKKPIVLMGSGSGGLEELKDKFMDDNVAYALFRVTDVVDDIPTVKFVFIQWVGEVVKPMTKAKITPHKGALDDVFRPFHIYIFATMASEISQRAVMDKVTSASGSKSHVK